MVLVALGVSTTIPPFILKGALNQASTMYIS